MAIEAAGLVRDNPTGTVCHQVRQITPTWARALVLLWFTQHILKKQERKGCP